ncbi:hypothetical protein AgCh_029156 [Apium graveolens]
MANTHRVEEWRKFGAFEKEAREGVVDAVKPKGSNPFGNARPREEVLKEKGQYWKEVDETLESSKLKEKEVAGLSDGPSFEKRSFDGHEDIALEAETRKIYRADYFDKHGRSVVIMRPEMVLQIANINVALHIMGPTSDVEKVAPTADVANVGPPANVPK